MSVFSCLLAVTVLTFGLSTKAQQNFPSHEATPHELFRAKQKNQQLQSTIFDLKETPNWQPSHDTADFAYVLMNADDEGVSEVANLRKTIAENLPAHVKLVILTNKYDEASVRAKYSQWIAVDRLLIVADNNNYTDNGFWARDSFPVPVVSPKTGKASLVGARYFRTFNSGPVIASSLHGKYKQENFIFVGGNLLADEEGNCFSVSSDRLFGLTENDLRAAYGCKTTHLMRYVSGIGDVDEVLKPLPGRRILTNTAEYKRDLEAWGYKVIMLPSLTGTYRTYANSLIVQSTVFMPVYGIPQDQQATQVYESLGYRVVPVPTNYLSDKLHGSIHCQTMAYPPMDAAVLLQALKTRSVY